MPKHLLLAESLRHLFRSEELNSLIFRLGHCESYSFTLELETAIANSQKLSPRILAPTTVPNPDFVFHCCWNNFDVIEKTYCKRYQQVLEPSHQAVSWNLFQEIKGDWLSHSLKMISHLTTEDSVNNLTIILLSYHKSE